ncbi:MAG: FAD-dependent oxidoreductase [Pseudoxanthomonas sp.]
MASIANALVVGGGGGGMSAAIQLSRQGVEVTLVERNPDWAPDGAGITLGSPTLRALREVGVVEEVLARGGHWSAVDIRDADGQLQATHALAPAIGAEDLPAAAGILRPELAGILARATCAAGVQVRLGCEVVRLDQDEGGVDVVLSDGAGARYDLVVGADGVHSSIRRWVLPGFAGPRFSGQGSWRAVVPRTEANSTIYMGRNIKAGLNPVSQSQCYLFVLDPRKDMDYLPPEQWTTELAGLLAEFGGQVGRIREGLLDGSLAQARVLYRPLAGHLIPPPWHYGRVVLLGDAVHATTPHLASGAGIAIEGALILAEELRRRHSLDGALAAYAGRHYDRAALVVTASGLLGLIEQNAGSHQEHHRLMVDTLEALRAPL